MIERRRRIGLAAETRQEDLPRIFVSGDSGAQDFHGDMATWALLASQVDRAHATDAERTLERG